MNLEIRLPSNADFWTVTRKIAGVLHDDDFQPNASDDRMNFQLKFKESTVSETRNSGGILTIHNATIATKFLRWVKDHPIKIERDKLRFYASSTKPGSTLIETLRKTFYTDPDLEEKHEEILRGLEDRFRVEAVQIGVFHRTSYPERGALYPRDFSIEWEKICTGSGPSGWLTFEYDHKHFQITMQSISETYGKAISIEFASIQKMAVGYDPKPYICFDLLYPPTFQETDNNSGSWRLTSLEPSHQVISPYAYQLRLLLWSGGRNDVMKDFVEMCRTAGLTSNITLVQLYRDVQVQAFRSKLFSRELMHRYENTLRRVKFPWPVTFQLASLLYNGVLHTNEILDLLPSVQEVYEAHLSDTGDLLKQFHDALLQKAERQSPKACFQEILQKFKPRKARGFNASLISAAHVTITPTRMLLEGPLPTQSNNAIRKYKGCDDNFIRVDFRDEDRSSYKRNQDVDDMSVLRERVGDVLKQGIMIAGRHFQFLAYSTSSLREHAVWFMSSFESGGEMITPQKVVRDLGDFSALAQQPSKYAARIAQKFSATDPSVHIHGHEWERVDDIEYIEERTIRNDDGDIETRKTVHCFTDGVGTISESLGQEIFETLRNNEGRLEEKAPLPSAYQIRFMGSKGVVVVDKQLDKNSSGIRMRLRPSMIKFPSLAQSEPLEISEAFRYPKLCYLNRPLVMFLEDLGVRLQTFLDLQNAAIAEAQTIDDSLEQFRSIMETHRGGLGKSFDFPDILKHFEDDGFDLHSQDGRPGIDNQFIKQLRNVARIEVLREIKHSARIKIPDSYLLVGVADEGPAYRKDGYQNVYELPEGHIYACVQKAGDKEPTWLSGSCSISRSPVAHPGDVQRVRCIGKPPEDKLCLFSHLVNVVVLPSVGKRSLASCLGGGDLDGDIYSVIMLEPLLPTQMVVPASYDSLPPRALPPGQSIEEAVCDFIVEYIHSDVLGLLSNRLLVIADQSKEGVFDQDCEHLAVLCSQAVDYPKQGNPVDLSGGALPHPLIRCKPDWQSAEINAPRQTDYYKSTRALGVMFRDHRLEVDGPLPEMEQRDRSAEPLLSDPISLAYKDRVQRHIGTAIEPSEHEFVTTLFQRYVAELSYICAIHTLSNSRTIRLREEEVVAGTILASCNNKRMRRDRIERVKVHSGVIVKEIRQDLVAPGYHDSEKLTPDARLAGQLLTLERA